MSPDTSFEIAFENAVECSRPLSPDEIADTMKRVMARAGNDRMFAAFDLAARDYNAREGITTYTDADIETWEQSVAAIRAAVADLQF